MRVSDLKNMGPTGAECAVVTDWLKEQGGGATVPEALENDELVNRAAAALDLSAEQVRERLAAVQSIGEFMADMAAKREDVTVLAGLVPPRLDPALFPQKGAAHPPAAVVLPVDEDTLRQLVRDEVRQVVREELERALAALWGG